MKRERRDLFNYKLIVNFYRSKYYPLTFQIFLVMILTIFIYDGFVGPESSDENLLTLSLSGLFWYPLIFGSLFFLGRSWCAVCPVGAIAGAANRFSIGHKFPRILSNLGLPLIAFVVPLWGFREFGINILREPLVTAVWIVGVIAVAIIVSIIFKGRVFCKYMCPISVPLAVMSRIAPLEVRTTTMATHSNNNYNKNELQQSQTKTTTNSASSMERLPLIDEIIKVKKSSNVNITNKRKIDPTCKTCLTHDCYKGNDETEGCPWEQHPATMMSNSECSMCMKCTNSCPSIDPMRLRLRMPFSELWQVFRPNIYEAFTILALIGIFNLYLWHEIVDTMVFPGFKQNLVDSVGNVFSFLSEKQIEKGIIGYIMALGITIGLYSAAAYTSSKLSGLKFKSNFANFSYAYLALFVIFAIMGTTFGQIAMNGGTYLTAALHQIGIYLYLPATLVDTNDIYKEYEKLIAGTISAIISGYVAYKIAKSMISNNTRRKTIIIVLPHLFMILFMTLLFTTIEPRWS